MIDSGKDIICKFEGNEKVGRIVYYIGAGNYRVYLLDDKKYVDINIAEILKIDIS